MKLQKLTIPFMAIGLTVANQTFCQLSDIGPEGFKEIYAVPMLASSEAVAKYEEKNIYFIRSIGFILNIARYYKSEHCLDKKRVIVDKHKPDRTDIISHVYFDPSYCNLTDLSVPPFLLTGVKVAKNLRLLALMSCGDDEGQINVTILVGCLAYWMEAENYDWETEANEFLGFRDTKPIHFFKVFSKERLQFQFDLLKGVLKRRDQSRLVCSYTFPTKLGLTDLRVFFILSGGIVVMLGGIAVTEFCKRNTNRISPIN